MRIGKTSQTLSQDEAVIGQINQVVIRLGRIMLMIPINRNGARFLLKELAREIKRLSELL